MIRTTFFSALALLTTLCVPLAVGAQNETLAKVNGVSVPQARLDAVIKTRTAGKQPDSPQIRSGIKDTLINQEVISQEAVKKGVDKKPEIAAQIEIQRQEVLVNAYLQDYLKSHPISNDAVKKEFERIKPQIPTKEFKARHILVAKEDVAKDITSQIKNGGSFEKLAAEHSTDTGSKARGGDLGWSPATRYVKPFGEALSKLKKGQMTDPPVQTQYGWHVIRLDDERPVKVPTIEEAKPKITQMLQQQLIQKMVSDLRSQSTIE
jgi:peptidyl-prolyl cis-trans isomerase C